MRTTHCGLSNLSGKQTLSGEPGCENVIIQFARYPVTWVIAVELALKFKIMRPFVVALTEIHVKATCRIASIRNDLSFQLEVEKNCYASIPEWF